MNVARPITDEEYGAFRKEIEQARFTVPLDSDPTLQPKNINEKLALVQGFKDRMVVILNRAIRAEAYWKTMVKTFEAKLEAEINRAMVTDEVRKGSSDKLRQAMATNLAGQNLVAAAFKGEGTYEGHLSKFQANHADAICFMCEVQNLYDNLDATADNLARQLKSVIVNTGLYGKTEAEEDSPAGRGSALSVGA